MKHLLRNSHTKKYFSYGTWTSNFAKAQIFADTLSAISFSVQNGLQNVEMVLMLGTEPSAENDVRLPLSAHPQQAS